MGKPGQTYEPILAGWAVGSIVREICERAGVPYDAIDVDLVEGFCDGFSTTNGQTASAAIEALAGIFMFDASNYDAALHFIPRGGSHVATIPPGDLIDTGRDVEMTTRHDAINIPKVMNLQYLDTEGGLTPDKQTSDRSLDSRASAESRQETTVIMRADDAARAVTILHKVSIEEQRGEKQFSLSDNWLGLTVGDVVRLNDERLRITSVDIDEGMQKYKAVYDRLSAYETEITGLPIQIPSDPPGLEPSESVLQVMDTHILASADDQLGYYVAASSLTQDWAGAVVELSKDGGANWIDSGFIGANAIMGETISALTTHPVWYPDRINAVDVELLRSDMELLSATLTEMMNRANLAIIGDELINFGGAEQLTETTWRLSFMLRGRKGSPIVPHAIGERFVLLATGAYTFVPAELFELGRELTFRVTSLGLSAPGTTQTFTLQGMSQTERAPAYLRAVRDGANIHVSWQGVGRLGGGASVGMGAYFTGHRVTLGATSVDTTAMTVTIPYTAGTLSVRQVNQITGPGPAATLGV